MGQIRGRHGIPWKRCPQCNRRVSRWATWCRSTGCDSLYRAETERRAGGWQAMRAIVDAHLAQATRCPPPPPVTGEARDV